MSEIKQWKRIESRWPVIVTVLAVIIALAFLPSRARLFPLWVPYFIAAGLVVPMAGVWLSAGHPWCLRIERVTTFVFAAMAELVMLTTLVYLIHEMMVRPDDFSGRQLFTSSIAAWITNVLVFSLLYWGLDRGGPEARANGEVRCPDWLFPQTDIPEVATPDWHPTFLDYLFLAFTAATAFSPAESLPLTHRAKLLMMLESMVSLTTLVVVASRAIGLLGT